MTTIQDLTLGKYEPLAHSGRATLAESRRRLGRVHESWAVYEHGDGTLWCEVSILARVGDVVTVPKNEGRQALYTIRGLSEAVIQTGLTNPSPPVACKLALVECLYTTY